MYFLRFRFYLSLGASRLAVADDLREHVRLAQDQVLVGLDLDLRAAVLREDDDVVLGEVERDALALVVEGARPDGQDGAALRLLLCRVRQDDAGDRGLLLLEDFDDQAVAQGLQIHSEPPQTSGADVWHSRCMSASGHHSGSSRRRASGLSRED